MNKSCLSDEIMACYAEGRLKGNDLILAEAHLKECGLCAEIVVVQKECVLARERGEFTYAPAELYQKLKEKLNIEPAVPLLEIIINFKEKVLEAIRTTGEFLPLSSMQPAHALRGEAELKDAVIIREKFGSTEVTVEMTRQGDEYFRAVLKTINVQTAMPNEDLRVNLLQGETELESYRTLNGRAVFETLKPGDYILQILQKDQVIGNVRMSLKRV